MWVLTRQLVAQALAQALAQADKVELNGQAPSQIAYADTASSAKQPGIFTCFVSHSLYSFAGHIFPRTLLCTGKYSIYSATSHFGTPAPALGH
jgi:hypothetical protein